MNELLKYTPNHIKVINQMRDLIFENEGVRLSLLTKDKFNDFERVSIDYAVMEKSNLIYCIPTDIGWSDVGGYNTLHDLFNKDDNNNVIKNAKYIYLDSKNNIIISDNKNRLITSIGVENMVIVDSINGVLVCNRDDTQQIKRLLKKI